MNYTEIAEIPRTNLYDWIVNLSASQAIILIILCDKTNGSMQQHIQISLKELVECTGFSRKGIINCINYLIEKKIISKIKSHNTDGGSAINKYKINFNTRLGAKR